GARTHTRPRRRQSQRVQERRQDVQARVVVDVGTLPPRVQQVVQSSARAQIERTMIVAVGVGREFMTGGAVFLNDNHVIHRRIVVLGVVHAFDEGVEGGASGARLKNGAVGKAGAVGPQIARDL